MNDLRAYWKMKFYLPMFGPIDFCELPAADSMLERKYLLVVSAFTDFSAFTIIDSAIS